MSIQILRQQLVPFNILPQHSFNINLSLSTRKEGIIAEMRDDLDTELYLKYILTCLWKKNK